jgi:hypothetical protein
VGKGTLQGEARMRSGHEPGPGVLLGSLQKAGLPVVPVSYPVRESWAAFQACLASDLEDLSLSLPLLPPRPPPLPPQGLTFFTFECEEDAPP